MKIGVPGSSLSKMKTPNWEELTEKLLNYYEMALKSLTISRDEGSKGSAKEIRKEIIAIGRLLDESEKSLIEATQELEKHSK